VAQTFLSAVGMADRNVCPTLNDARKVDMNSKNVTNENSSESQFHLNPIPKKTRVRLRWKILGGFIIWCIIADLSFPIITNQLIKANCRAVGERGRDIVLAMNEANKSRAIAGLPPVWPKTILSITNSPDDISSKVFQTSSDYFYELYDGCHVGTDQHKPYVKGFEYSKLAGAGVLAKAGNGKLAAANNMWIIAANITDEDDDRIPLLMTRNVDAKFIENLVNQGVKGIDFEKRLEFSKTYLDTFGHKHMVFVYKNGKFRVVRARSRTLGDLFNNKELPPRDPSKPPIVYLMP